MWAGLKGYHPLQGLKVAGHGFGQILSWCKLKYLEQKNRNYAYSILWLHCSWRTHDGKRFRSLHPVPCYLRQRHHTIPLINWSSFIIKPVRLLLATHSSCWKAVLELPSSAGCKLSPAFKENLLNRTHFSLLSECTILIQLGGKHRMKALLCISFISQIWENLPQILEAPCMDERWAPAFFCLLFRHGMRVTSLWLLSFPPFHFGFFFKARFLPGRVFFSAWCNTPGQLAAKRKHLYKWRVQNLGWTTTKLQIVHSGAHRITRPSLKIVKCWEVHSEQQDGLLLPSRPWVCYGIITCRIN